MAKPAGLATIPGRGEPPGQSVLEQVGALLGLPASGSADPRVRVVHRLDKDTSGVLLFAKNAAAQRHFSHQFQNNTVEKEYLALVAGSPRPTRARSTPRSTATRRPEAHVRRPARRAAGADAVESRAAVPRAGRCLRVFPKTGKTHQIRVHLKHAGMPLAVDPLYNPQPPGAGGRVPGIYLSTIKRGYQLKRGGRSRR